MNEAGLSHALRTVFTVYAAFWAVVIVVLLVAVGPLLRKSERSRNESAHHGSTRRQGEPSS